MNRVKFRLANRPGGVGRVNINRWENKPTSYSCSWVLPDKSNASSHLNNYITELGGFDKLCLVRLVQTDTLGWRVNVQCYSKVAVRGRPTDWMADGAISWILYRLCPSSAWNFEFLRLSDVPQRQLTNCLLLTIYRLMCSDRLLWTIRVHTPKFIYL